ncbi:MAG: hypothetical protein HYR88_00520 [Verrucomicrobia bacterium]|nr:hypothetical protein [Verrucomicrobiota bacterium]MBI3869519.1 hypothetical protein [Verrucomicrobiota bacterium]
MFLIVMILGVLALPRRWALLPLLIGIHFFPLTQEVEIAGVQMYGIRILLLFYLVRHFVRSESRPIEKTTLDRVVVYYCIGALLLSIAREPGRSGIMAGLGASADFALVYFFTRHFIHTREDVQGAMISLLITSCIMGFFMLVEMRREENPFSFLGTVHEMTQVRDGKLRCQGAFAHPITAGLAGASLLGPLLLWAWSQPRRNFMLLLAGGSTVATAIASGSSAPVLTLGFAAMALVIWNWREHTRLMLKLCVLGAIGLHCVMKAPVWHLIGRLSDITGGTGFHRVQIIDQAINHFSEWWLTGTTVTAHWLDFRTLPNDPNNVDITNQYVAEGVTGGLIRMFLFMWLLREAFLLCGKARAQAEATGRMDRAWLSWGWGVCLFAHVTAFISVCYYDQLHHMIPMTFAIIAGVHDEILRADSQETYAGAPAAAPQENLDWMSEAAEGPHA